MERLLKYKKQILMFCLVLAALAAFGATLRLGFIWDDHQFIEANPYIKTWTPANLKHAFLSDPFNQALNYYRPFQTLSNMLDFSIWRLNPFGYHLTNLAFHAAGALLVFALMGELGLGCAAAFLAALFFAVNPTGIEQMIIVAGRAELASSAFTLASVLLFLRRGYAFSFLAFLMALGFKENGIITPLLTALSLWFLGKEKREYLKLLPFLLPIPFYLWLRHAATGAGPLDTGAAAFLLQAAKKLPPAGLVYIKNAILPLNMHSHRMQPDFAPWFYAAYVFWALFLAALLRYRARAALFSKGPKCGARTAAFAFGWYFIALAPKFPLLAGGDLMLEHWTYLSNLGLYLGAAMAAALGLRIGGLKRAAALACAGVLALFWLSAANANILLRSTDLKIYEHAARYSGSKPMLYNLAREYYLAGRFDKSRALLERVSSLDPENTLYLNGLALSLWKTGAKNEAAALLDRVLVRQPDSAETLINRACLFMEEDAFSGAERLFKRAIEKSPGSEAAYDMLAELYLKQRKEAQALAVYEALLRLDPYNQEALNNAGIINAKNGRYDAAGALFKRVLEIEPGSKSAAMNLERLESLKKPAIEHRREIN
ncbi:MAG: tetratricopeptide repeat protein [Elusimicrobia bacterium]|nr:tetratricopeptide repeat protein [Elusimicrobiota bacterium]